VSNLTFGPPRYMGCAYYNPGIRIEKFVIPGSDPVSGLRLQVGRRIGILNGLISCIGCSRPYTPIGKVYLNCRK